MNKRYDDIGVSIPSILLPKNADLTKWAVVACDQYTSEPEYWEETERIVGGAPSTLRLMLPEMYLEKPGEEQRIEDINKTMNKYLEDGTLSDVGQGLMLVRRTVTGNVRLGLMIALDLERYDYTKGSKTLIRASEGTIVERIPPRLRIRQDAPLEMPHILVLIDDPGRTVIEAAALHADDGNKIYDFELMQGGGHLTGWFLRDENIIGEIADALAGLGSKRAFSDKYDTDEPPMLFAMGDGNHSFATAKAYWENKKKTLSETERENHPARYCLVELENIHDEGIVFEPIHRVLFGLNAQSALNRFCELLKEANGNCEDNRFLADAERDAAANNERGGHILPYVWQGGCGYFRVDNPKAQLEVGTLQQAIDQLLKEQSGTVDYVHGQDVVNALGKKPENIGFLLPPMEKSAFFRTVIFDGALPRKTFSMGEANEKRYYMECRLIDPKIK